MKTIIELMPATGDCPRLVAVTTTKKFYRCLEVMIVDDDINPDFSVLLRTIQGGASGKLADPISSVAERDMRPEFLPLFAHAFQHMVVTVERWGMDTGNKTEDVLK